MQPRGKSAGGSVPALGFSHEAASRDLCFWICFWLSHHAVIYMLSLYCSSGSSALLAGFYCAMLIRLTETGLWASTQAVKPSYHHPNFISLSVHLRQRLAPHQHRVCQHQRLSARPVGRKLQVAASAPGGHNTPGAATNASSPQVNKKSE